MTMYKTLTKDQKDKHKLAARRWREKNPSYQQQWVNTNKVKVNTQVRSNYRNHDKVGCMVRRAKTRARKYNIPFDIDKEYVESIWNDVCPILGIPLYISDGGASDNSPSLDRMNNDKGYVKGNVLVCSWKANKIKQHGTAEEHRKIADFLTLLEAVQKDSAAA